MRLGKSGCALEALMASAEAPRSWRSTRRIRKLFSFARERVCVHHASLWSASPAHHGRDDQQCSSSREERVF
jgi:hypothetical protein